MMDMEQLMGTIQNLGLVESSYEECARVLDLPLADILELAKDPDSYFSVAYEKGRASARFELEVARHSQATGQFGIGMDKMLYEKREEEYKRTIPND